MTCWLTQSRDEVLEHNVLSERCRRLPAMFTPVHEMAHQICILNAYMRESELMHDGIHPTLWAVLDEMIDMHHRLEPKSLFGGERHGELGVEEQRKDQK